MFLFPQFTCDSETDAFLVVIVGPLDPIISVWQILFGVSLSLNGCAIVFVLVYCRFWKSQKSPKYAHIQKIEDSEICLPSLPDNEANDSGVHTPLSAQSSAASMDSGDKDETIRMKIDDTARHRQGEQGPTNNNINTNHITIHINNQANTEAAAKNDPPKPGPVTTIGIEETTGKKKEKSPNTERKVVDRHVEPRTELDSNDIHQPSDDDSGEKAINHTQFENPSAAGQSSRPQTHHAQENQDTKAKVMMYSGEVDRQDLGS